MSTLTVSTAASSTALLMSPPGAETTFAIHEKKQSSTLNNTKVNENNISLSSGKIFDKSYFWQIIFKNIVFYG